MMRIIRIRLSDSLGVYRTMLEGHPADGGVPFAMGRQM